MVVPPLYKLPDGRYPYYGFRKASEMKHEQAQPILSSGVGIDDYHDAHADGVREGWQQAIRAAVKATCPACRAGIPLGPYAYYRHDVPPNTPGIKPGAYACAAAGIHALPPPARGGAETGETR